MRMMLTATFPNEPFNTLVRENKAGQTLNTILEELKPEAGYFMEQHGMRCAVLIVDVAEPSRIPSFAEPFFLRLNADCRFRPVMTAADLGNAGLEELSKKWR